jgi:hypothetical protein
LWTLLQEPTNGDSAMTSQRTNSPSDGRTKKTTRRRLITGGAAAAAATAATVARPDSAAATNGDPLVLGQDNLSTDTTRLTCDGQGGDQWALSVHANRCSTAISAIADSTSWACVAASGGLVGLHGIGDETGVVGASSGSGIGVLAHGGEGPALQVLGRAEFSRAGVATIAAGSATAFVTTAGPLAPTTLVLAVLQDDRPGRWVASAAGYPPTTSLRITLNEPVDVATRVGWFVVN